jgi:hypothetical protein
VVTSSSHKCIPSTLCALQANKQPNVYGTTDDFPDQKATSASKQTGSDEWMSALFGASQMQVMWPWTVQTEFSGQTLTFIFSGNGMASAPCTAELSARPNDTRARCARLSSQIGYEQRRLTLLREDFREIYSQSKQRSTSVFIRMWT